MLPSFLFFQESSNVASLFLYLNIINHFGKELHKWKKIIPVIIYIVLVFIPPLGKYFLTTYTMSDTVLDSRDNSEKHQRLCFPGADSLMEETVNQMVMDQGDKSYTT